MACNGPDIGQMQSDVKRFDSTKCRAYILCIACTLYNVLVFHCIELFHYPHFPETRYMRHLLNLHFNDDNQINIICALINIVNGIKVKALWVKLIIEPLRCCFLEYSN